MFFGEHIFISQQQHHGEFCFIFYVEVYGLGSAYFLQRIENVLSGGAKSVNSTQCFVSSGVICPRVFVAAAVWW